MTGGPPTHTGRSPEASFGGRWRSEGSGWRAPVGSSPIAPVGYVEAAYAPRLQAGPAPEPGQSARPLPGSGGGPVDGLPQSTAGQGGEPLPPQSPGDDAAGYVDGRVRFGASPRRLIVSPPRLGHTPTPSIQVVTSAGELGAPIFEEPNWDGQPLAFPAAHIHPSTLPQWEPAVEGEAAAPIPLVSEPSLAAAIHHRPATPPRASLFWRILTGQSDPCATVGMGQFHVPHAMFQIDTTAPRKQYRFRFELADNFLHPDRSEYFWAKTGSGGLGPALPETAVDAQTFRLMMESGGEKFSTQTEIPIWAVNPEVNPNHAGLGDMSIATKLVLWTTERAQLTQLTRTILPTGAGSSGLGTKHTSMEVGFLFRYQTNPRTYLHQELKYWIPIGGNPEHSGQILRYGAGLSHVWYDSLKFAVIPSLEYVFWSAQNGLQTAPDGTLESIDGQFSHAVFPGLRLATMVGADRLEIGMFSGHRFNGSHYFGTQGVLQFNWLY